MTRYRERCPDFESFLERCAPVESHHTVTEFVLRWDELREQGRPVSPEELCRDCPEHLSEVRRRVQAMQAMYNILASSSDEMDSEKPAPQSTANM